MGGTVRLDAAAAAVAYLTAMTTGWNDDATEQMVYEFERLDNETALGEAVAKVARTWTFGGRPSLGVIMDAYNHELALQTDRRREEVSARAVRCDGSGWLDGDDLAPCPTCNPALHRVWNEPGAKLRWRHGVPTWRVLGYDTPELFDKDLKRERCPAALDYEHESFDSRIGMRVALDAYRTEYGREPSATQRAWIVGAGRPARTRSDEF
jgi:hypothetical protein